MAGITNGVPEVGVGEPLKLGDNGEYEVRQDPITDKLEITDTANGTTAYVRPESNGQIGGNGAFIRSLINSEPLADDGRTYPSIQEAERAANGWVFVPPGTFNEDVTIDTSDLTLMGAGRSSHIDGGTGQTIVGDNTNITVRDLSVTTTATGDSAAVNDVRSAFNVHVRDTANYGFRDVDSVVGCVVEQNASFSGITVNEFAANNIVKSSARGIVIFSDDVIAANNVVLDSSANGIQHDPASNDTIIIGNRVINSGDNGINIRGGSDHIIANNRVSDSTNADINDAGTSTVLDANLTGASN